MDQPERSFEAAFQLPFNPSGDYPVKICKISAKYNFRRETGREKKSTRYGKCEML